MSRFALTDSSKTNSRHDDPLLYCYFFCAAGPISLLNAKYDTCKLDNAESAIYKSMSMGIAVNKNMNIPTALVS
jgi:hypothetical protein